MEKILVPIDFSENSKHALEYAVAIAEAFQYEIVLYHTTPLPVGAVDLAQIPVNMEWQQEAEEASHKQLDKWVADFHSKTSQPLSFKAETSMGDLIPSVKLYLEEANVELVVMGTKGAEGGLMEWMGTNTTDLIAETQVPVLVIPEGAKYQGFKKLLYATNFEVGDQSSIREVLTFAQAFGARLDLVHVTAEKSHPGNYVEIVEADNKPFDVPEGVRFLQVRTKEVESGIEELAKDTHADLIAVVRPMRGFWDSLFHHSVTKNLAMHCDRPLLILRP